MAKEVKLVIKDCYFGDNTAAVYNFIEAPSSVHFANGSEISGNTWSKNSYSHNVINIYGMSDNATFTIKDNVFEKSVNAVRVGLADVADNVHIVMNHNTYNETDAGDYAGLFLIQPYGKATQSMAGVTIRVEDTVNNTTEPQIGYYYAGADDTQLPVLERPKVYIDRNEIEYNDVAKGTATWSTLA